MCNTEVHYFIVRYTARSVTSGDKSAGSFVWTTMAETRPIFAHMRDYIRDFLYSRYPTEPIFTIKISRYREVARVDLSVMFRNQTEAQVLSTIYESKRIT